MMNPDTPDPTRLFCDPLAGVDARAAPAAGMQQQPWEPPLPAELAAVLTDYEVLDVIGRGGMGAIYKARDPQLDRLVAIKLLPPELSGRVDLVERFTREARALARLDHPNIVKVYDFSHTAAGHLYFVMEYVDGLDLGRILGTRGQTVPWSEQGATLEIIGLICDALQYAHNKGIVHRDIKPSNVLISKEGQVKVADFGLARAIDPGDGSSGFHGAQAMTVSGLVMGTLEYMAPEQRDGHRVDHRADIYAVGVLFYQMLTGHLPRGAFPAPSRKTGHTDARLDKVVLKALQSEPGERYQRASEVRDAVQALGKLKSPAPARNVRPQPLASESSIRPSDKSSRFRPLGWAALIFLLLLTGGILAYNTAFPGIKPSPKLPATLTFSSITEKGNPKVNLEASFTYIIDGKISESIPVSSFEKVPLNLSPDQRSSGNVIYIKVSAPNSEDSSLIPISPGPQESASIPPIVLAPETSIRIPELPQTLIFSRLVPESGITLSLGSSSVPVFPGKSLSLSAFGQLDSANPLTLTANAPGYKSFPFTLEPGSKGTNLEIELQEVIAEFVWRSEPAGWFSEAVLKRLDSPPGQRVRPLRVSPEGEAIPVGKYAISGKWGGAEIMLHPTFIHKEKSQPVTLTWRLPPRSQWTGVLDLNPLPVLTGQTSGLKSVAGEWKLKVPVPFFLELHQGGTATLRVFTPEIMQLALIGVMTGNLSESAIEKQPRLVSETFREKVIAPLTTNSTDLGKWFKAFWREQENTRLARNEAWRTNLFIASRTQSEFIGGILTSPDPFPLFADLKYQAATNYFLPAISLQVSAFEEGALQFSYSNGKRAFRLSSDGVTARYHDPIQGDIELKPH